MADSVVDLAGLTALAARTAQGGLSPDEARLLEGLQAGSESAYEELIQRYQHPIFNLVLRLLDHPADAADVAQEVFLKVFRNVGSFRGDSSLRTWVYRIAVNEARNRHRWFGRHSGKEVALETDAGMNPGDWLEDSAPSPFERTLDRETEAVIETALREIPASFRSALVLREVEGLSYEEIAEVLGANLGTVKSRILRGRQALRDRVAAAMVPRRPVASRPSRIGFGGTRQEAV